jgi:hypothetical protein
MQNSRVHASPPLRGCCMRRWPQSTGISYVQFGSFCKKRENFACVPLASSMLSHPLMCFVFECPLLEQHGHAYIVGRGDPGAASSRHCGGRPRRGGTSCKDFCTGGCCNVGQHRPSCLGCRRPGRSGREGGMGEVIESGGGECHGARLCSREC